MNNFWSKKPSFHILFLIFHRGPSSGANHYDSYDLKYNGNSHRPPANLANAGHINPYLSKHGFYGPINPKDRISIGGGKRYSLLNFQFFSERVCWTIYRL